MGDVLPCIFHSLTFLFRDIFSYRFQRQGSLGMGLLVCEADEGISLTYCIQLANTIIEHHFTAFTDCYTTCKKPPAILFTFIL